MRTTITISDELMQELLKYTHARSRNEAVNKVINDWLRMQKLAEFKKLRGRVKIDDNIEKLRQTDLKKLEGLNEEKDND